MTTDAESNAFFHYTELEEGSLFRAAAFLEPSEAISHERCQAIHDHVMATLQQAAAAVQGEAMQFSLPALTAATVACPAELVRMGLVSSCGTIKPIIDIDEGRGSISITWMATRGRS